MAHSPDVIAAADLAVKKVFAILGVDIEKPESVEAFREDLRFGRKLRKLTDRGLFSIAAVTGAALIAAVWAGIQALLRR